MNKAIKKLIESLYKFNPADYEEELEDEVLNQAKKFIEPSIPELLYSLYNIDSIPNKWKTEKDPKSGFINLYYTYKDYWYGDLKHMPDVGKRLVSLLIVGGDFVEYTSSRDPYAHINKSDIRSIRNNWDSDVKKINKLKQALKKWEEEYRSFPLVIQQYFDLSPTYKTIWLSADQGILILIETGYDTKYLKRDESTLDYAKVTIKLSGLVSYEIPEKVKDDKKYKVFIKKQKFFDTYLTRSMDSFGDPHTTNEIKKYICKYFMVTKQNEPVYIGFFNMDNMINLALTYLKPKKIPTILATLVYKGFNVLSLYEKDDKNSKYELFKDCIHIYIYDTIPENMKKYINLQTIILPHNTKNKSKLKDPDHLLIVKLDSYAYDMYNEIFNKQ